MKIYERWRRRQRCNKEFMKIYERWRRKQTIGYERAPHRGPRELARMHYLIILLCDPEYLQEEMENIEDVFVENGYSRTEVRRAMRERDERAENDEGNGEKKEIRGIVSIPNIPNVTRAYSRIAKQHKFQTTTRAENKIKDLAFKAKTPLGDKNKNVVYNIPCGCGKFSYTGETDRKWKTRRKEHVRM